MSLLLSFHKKKLASHPLQCLGYLSQGGVTRLLSERGKGSTHSELPLQPCREAWQPLIYLGLRACFSLEEGKCQGGQGVLSGSCYFDLHCLSPSAGFFFRLGINLSYSLILHMSFTRPKIQFYNLLVAP